MLGISYQSYMNIIAFQKYLVYKVLVALHLSVVSNYKGLKNYTKGAVLSLGANVPLVYADGV